jgi:hypothetical protein
MSFGDFARYIIGTNSSSFRWSSRRLGKPCRPTRKEQYEAFITILTPRQKRAIERYLQIRDIVTIYRRLDHTKRKELSEVEFTDEQLQEELQTADKQLRKQLGKKKSAQLSDDIMQYIENPHEDELRFDLSLAQRWILHRVFELGWTVERFGNFDRNIDYRGGKAAHKPERIGKKYQWLAYHEFLARVADNFEFRGDHWREPKEEKYDGPWQDLYIRDIDPSWGLPKTHQIDGWHGFELTWWAPARMEWGNSVTDKDWIRDCRDLPGVEPLIAVINPNNNSPWLTLESSYCWEAPGGDTAEDTQYPKRSIRYFLQSYIVKQSDVDALYEWMKTQWRATEGLSLPDSYPLHRVFLGECFWAPAFLYHNVPYYHHVGWVGGKAGDTIPKPILVATDQYAQEDSGFDCSIDESIRVYLPCKWIADGMNLHWRGIEGHLYDAIGDLVAFDPSVNSIGPGTLLVNRELFLKHLDEQGYTLLWVVTGEKVIITGNIPGGDDWPGRLNILGVFRIQGGEIRGELFTRLSE